MQDVFTYVLFSISNQDFNIGQLILTIVSISVIYFLYRLFLRKYFPALFENTEISQNESQRLGRNVRYLAILCFILAAIISLNLDKIILNTENFQLSVTHIIKALIFYQIAKLADWVISNLFIHQSYARRDAANRIETEEKDNSANAAKRTVQYIFYTIVAFYLLHHFNLDFALFERNVNGEQVSFKLSNIIHAIMILLMSRLLVWIVTQLILYNIYKSNNVALGSRFAINQLVKYIIYIFAFIMALDVFGINMNLLIGGAAALLVGIGLGLQQTFNDFVSGIVLLFERSVSVGDVLEVDGEIGTVKKIGLRASTLETRGNISIVVPNHKLVNEKVLNWNHFNNTVRFHIDLGVAYGSDTQKVKELLLQSIEKNPYVLKFPASFVRFQEFGESSLNFSLYFFSKNLRVIEDIKSDIRMEIDSLFRINGISIPFPQREIKLINKTD